MTAAGVQNIDSAAYVPAPPSTSTPDAKGTGAAGKQPTDPQSAATSGEPSDFHSELASQQSGAQQTAIQAGQDWFRESRAPANPGRNGMRCRITPILSAVTPVQVAEPQKQILPLVA